MRNRRGFTLHEMIISMVIVSIIGGAFTKAMVSQTRFHDREAALRSARSIARGATNVLMADLRMVQDSGGVDSVTSDGKLIRILVPYRFGLVCKARPNMTTVSMLPSDSGMVAYSVYQGFAYRTSTGRYTYIFPNNPTTSGIPVIASTPADCTGNGSGQAQIRTVSTSNRPGNILDLPTSGSSGATVAAPAFFFQRVTYSFRTSGLYPGKLGLWRNVDGGVNEEIMAPFDASSGFRYYAAGDDDARATPPLVSEIRGMDLILTAISPRASAISPTTTARVTTSVFFKNVRSF